MRARLIVSRPCTMTSSVQAAGIHEGWIEAPPHAKDASASRMASAALLRTSSGIRIQRNVAA